MSTKIILALIFFQQPIDGAKGIVIGDHEYPPLQIDHGIRNAVLLAFIDPPAGQVRRNSWRDARSRLAGL